MKQLPKLCLNMIVKNEAKIIRRLLLSVHKLIDTYCICDTGSTDNTIEVITTFFEEKGISGKIIHEPFQDFGYNRTFALHACLDMDADYILLLDADMIFWRNLNISVESFKALLSADVYHVYQGSDTFYYKNTRIVRNIPGFTYWGVTHEYVNTPPNVETKQMDKNVVFIKDIGDGGSKADKFLRDIQLLRKGLEKDPDNDRYTFYLANSLKDSQQYEAAIEMYKKRIAIGGWIEEVWHSYYSMGKCYLDISKPENAIAAWMEGYNVYPNRIENLYEIVQHYRVVGKHKLAQVFYDLADDCRTKHPERDYLFMQKDVYDYKLDYEMSIIGYYQNPHKIDLALLSMQICANPLVDGSIAKNIMSNYKFYSSQARDHDTKWWIPLGAAVAKIGKSLMGKFPKFKASTPTFCNHPTISNRMYVNVRFVNYSINKDGGYENEEFIETKNVLAELEKKERWEIVRESFLGYNTTLDNVYVGLEDVRLYCQDGKIYYNANRGLSGGTMVVEHGWINRINFRTENEKLLKILHSNRIEKNWVMLPQKEIHMVYKWHPLVIGKIEEDEFVETNSIPTPSLFQHVRGSTNGILVEDEIWFLCHVVSYEDRRYYYHLMIVMDKEATCIKKYTKMFTFEGQKVEYALGMTWLENQFLIGFSTMDCETKLISLPKDWFLERMVLNKH